MKTEKEIKNTIEELCKSVKETNSLLTESELPKSVEVSESLRRTLSNELSKISILKWVLEEESK